MAIVDKNNVLDRLEQSTRTVIEMGCGQKKRQTEAIGIDALDFPDVDIVGDIYEILARFPCASVDEVYSYHFVEHVSDVPKLLSELARIVKPDGRVEFVAPHFSNPYFYSDPTHRSFFGLYTFCYYASESPFTRWVPTYGHRAQFKLAAVDLVFKSGRPFYIRHGIKLLIGSFFNSCNYLKELYEENFCYLFPCFEVRYLLRRHALDA
jgi:ubiquinone/menaquinone biosynthesis C-methylase UbiE